MRVLALTKYTYRGPSSRYRFYNYKQPFEQRGIYMDIEPFFKDSYFTAKGRFEKLSSVILSYLSRILLMFRLLIDADRYNLLLIEYELFPYFPPIFEYLLRKRGIKYIVDYDDAIFHKYDMSENRVIRFLFNGKIAKVIECANHVIVFNSSMGRSM